MGKLPPQAERGKCVSAKCGRDILWISVMDPAGQMKPHPVDPTRVRLYQPPDDEIQEEPHWTRGGLGYVSHFKTCPDADRFSKK